jgi:hypothetical protein
MKVPPANLAAHQRGELPGFGQQVVSGVLVVDRADELHRAGERWVIRIH